MMMTSWRWALLFGILAFAGRRMLWKPQPCHYPERIALSLLQSTKADVDACQVYSQSYHEARAKFRSAVQQLQQQQQQQQQQQITLDSLIVVNNDPNDDPYTMDIAVIPGNAPGWVIHTSGVHGVEGFAGSAIQLAALQLLDLKQQQHPTLILVHAVNPYGMAHYRRTNEHNVDLNRNGVRSGNAAKHSNRDNYDRFSSFFNPSRAPTVWFSAVQCWLRGLWALVWNGHATLKAAMVGGQYHKPKGIFYGGNGEIESSLQLLEEWLRDYLAQNNNKQNVVTWIDVHTGLGKFGVDSLLTSPKEFYEQQSTESTKNLDTWFPGAHHPLTSANAKSVTQGYEQVKGLIKEFYEPLFARAWIVTQEFGTVPTILVAHALIIENAAYHYLPPDQALEWAQQTTSPAFYPQSRLWRRRILERGIKVLEQAMNRSMILSSAKEEEEVA